MDNQRRTERKKVHQINISFSSSQFISYAIGFSRLGEKARWRYVLLTWIKIITLTTRDMPQRYPPISPFLSCFHLSSLLPRVTCPVEFSAQFAHALTIQLNPPQLHTKGRKSLTISDCSEAFLINVPQTDPLLLASNCDPMPR